MHQPVRPVPARRAARVVLPGLVAAGLLATAVALPSPAAAARRTSVGAAHAVPVPARSTAAVRTTPLSLGYDRLGVLRAGTWHLSGSLGATPVPAGPGGRPGDLPVAGDTDGSGEDSLSLFRSGLWLLRPATRPPQVVSFGRPGDLPVLGDWAGDGVDRPGVFRRGLWYLSLGRTTRVVAFGRPSDRPVAGDWNGDGRTDIGVQRGNAFYQQTLVQQGAGVTLRPFRYGLPGDVAVSGDWNHDGLDEVGVFRRGLWALRGVGGEAQQVLFGAAGDLPVVRRIRGLAPGVTHQVVKDPAGPFVEHVVRVALADASTPEVVLGAGRLAGTEPTSGMARRTGAVVAVNGDFFLGSGRPVHAFGSQGSLAQTQPGHGAGELVGFGADGTTVSMGSNDVHLSVSTDATGLAPPATEPVTRWNDGAAPGAELAGFTAAGAGVVTAPVTACWAALEPASPPGVGVDGAIDRNLVVQLTGCAAPPAPSATGVVLTATPGQQGAALLAGLVPGQTVHLATAMGFPGAVDVIGGSPQLVVDGQVSASAAIDGQGSFSARNPRTAVGVTADGTLLVVAVDGRHPGWSAGMTLRELAGLMLRLGARDAMNLDGGGSTTMWVDGVVANWPSDGFERSVGSALVVLPGAAAAQPGTLSPAGPTPADPTGLPATGHPALSRPPAARQLSDPGSTGGLLGLVR